MDALEEMVARAKELPPVDPNRHDYDSDRLFRDGYARVIEVVGEHRDRLVWGNMTYACRGRYSRPARPVPPDWDEIVKNAPEGYWEKRGGVPEIVDGMFPAQLGVVACGYEHKIWLGVGVEGPPSIRALDCCVPSPFYCGKCPQCGGEMVHVRWREDEEFKPRPFTDSDLPRLVVPSPEKAKEYVESGYGGGEFVESL